MGTKNELVNLDDLGTLVDIAEDLKINKSKLNYYFLLGLIEPKKTFSQTMVFSKQEVKSVLDEVEREAKSGIALREIAENFRKRK